MRKRGDNFSREKLFKPRLTKILHNETQNRRKGKIQESVHEKSKSKGKKRQKKAGVEV